MATWGPKDPDAVRDYGIDWSGDIGAATIAASSWLLDGVVWPGDAALEKVSSSSTSTGTVIRLGGGVDGTTYLVTNHVVLSNGEEDDFSIKLKIKDR